MRVRVYLTKSEEEPDREGTTLLLPEGHVGDPPPHPDGGTWKYLATVETEGHEAVRLTSIALRALEMQGFYMRRTEKDD